MHRNKSVSSSKMQNDLPESRTVGQPDGDEWRGSRTTGSHGDLFRHLWLLRLQYSDYNHLAKHSPINILTSISISTVLDDTLRTMKIEIYEYDGVSFIETSRRTREFK